MVTPTLHSRLLVPAMTAMTQICQYYKTEEKVHLMIPSYFFESYLSLSRWQSRLHAR